MSNSITVKKGSSIINVAASRLDHYKSLGYEPIEAVSAGKNTGKSTKQNSGSSNKSES